MKGNAAHIIYARRRNEYNEYMSRRHSIRRDYIEREDGGRLIPSEPYSREKVEDGSTSSTSSSTTMKQKRDKDGNELIDFSFTIYIPEDETAAADGINDSPTEEECKAASSTPILHTLAQAAAIGEKARAAHSDELADAMKQKARDIADRLVDLSEEPTAQNKARLVDALAMALHLASVAAADGITIPTVKRYPVDINANHLTAFFASAARAILTAHDDGRQEDEVLLSGLYGDATSIIRRAAAHVPIRHADAKAVIASIDELNKAVINI